MATRNVRTPGEKPEAVAPAEQAAAPVSDTGLPNAIDIDHTQITAPVLTNQGWVCPVEKLNPAAR